MLLEIQYPLIELLMYAALISALDPLSILPMLKRTEGARDLCTSEALVNPIVSISLFMLFASIRTFGTNVSTFLHLTDITN